MVHRHVWVIGFCSSLVIRLVTAGTLFRAVTKPTMLGRTLQQQKTVYVEASLFSHPCALVISDLHLPGLCNPTNIFCAGNDDFLKV